MMKQYNASEYTAQFALQFIKQKKWNKSVVWFKPVLEEETSDLP